MTQTLSWYRRAKAQVCNGENASLGRVTISGKVKIGTMDGDFSRDQIYGHFNFFFNKSGTLRCSSRLDHGGKNSALER